MPRRPRRARVHALALATALAALGAGAGTALALPSGWDPPERLSAPGVVARDPASGASGRGDLAVAWRARLPGGRQVVQVVLRRPLRTTWPAPFALGAAVARVERPRIAFAADGRLLVAWVDRSASGVARLRAAIVASSGTRARLATLATVRRGRTQSDDLAVAWSGGRRPAVAWIAPGPPSVNDPARRLGRAVVVVGTRTGRFGAPRALDRRPRPPTEGECASDSGVRLVPTPSSALLASWDCDDDIRDFELSAAQSNASGAFGPVERTGAIGRAGTGAALAPAGGGAVIGLWAEDDSDDLGDHMRRVARSAAGRWTSGLLPVASGFDDPDSHFALPYSRGEPAIVRSGGRLLGAWVSPFTSGLEQDVVWAVTGVPGTATFAPAAPVGPAAAGGATLGGVGQTATGTQVVVWAQSPGPGLVASLWTAVATPAAGGFTPAEQALVVTGGLLGRPAVALDPGGAGAVAWSRGPAGSAAVLASRLSIP
jgi:hypothetical protein